MPAHDVLPDNLTLHFDGACEPNPGGWATYGWILQTDFKAYASGEGVACKPGPDATNNSAEYHALQEGLRHLVNLGWRGSLMVKGDSQLVIRQMKGEWRCNAPHLAERRDRCRKLLQELQGDGDPHALFWVPREENDEADALSRMAYEEATGKPFPERRAKGGARR